MFEYILRKYKGYIKVTALGGNIERFLNLLHTRGIYIWDICYSSADVEFCMNIKDIYRLKDIIRKTKIKIKILERCGLPFFLFAYRKKKMFVLGMITGWIIVYIMSNYIWNISFEGNVRHTDDELMKFMESINITEGIKKNILNPEDIEKAIRNQYFDITWSSVEIDGTMLRIHMRENISQMDESSDNQNIKEYGDIVSSKEAVITSIITRTGVPKVKVGDIVKAGDKLIEGKYAILADDLTVIDEKYVLAEGDIIGKVTYHINEIIGREYTKKEYTGNRKEINIIKYDNNIWKLDFPWDNIEYECYDIVEYYKENIVGDSFYIPIESGCRQIREYRLKNEKYTDSQLEMLAQKKIMYILKKIEENTIQIIENNVKIEVGENGCTIYGDIIVLEDIGCMGDTYE